MDTRLQLNRGADLRLLLQSGLLYDSIVEIINRNNRWTFQVYTNNYVFTLGSSWNHDVYRIFKMIVINLTIKDLDFLGKEPLSELIYHWFDDFSAQIDNITLITSTTDCKGNTELFIKHTILWTKDKN